jgi:hypothetical protein
MIYERLRQVPQDPADASRGHELSPAAVTGDSTFTRALKVVPQTCKICSLRL